MSTIRSVGSNCFFVICLLCLGLQPSAAEKDSAAAAKRPAQALSANSLMGRWCSETSVYTFTPQQLTVTFLNGKPQRFFPIKTIEVHGDTLHVVWDEQRSTNFSEFTASEMAQMPNTRGDMGPRRAFHRC